MNDSSLIWLSAGLSAAGIMLLAAAMMIIWRRPRPIPASLPCAGPITRLDFAESLDPALFAQAAEEEVVSYARAHLAHLFADGASITLQRLRDSGGNFEMLVSASPKATAALRAGTATLQQHSATSRALPHVIDARSGGFIENLKAVSRGRRLIAGAAAASAIVVSAAHMISAADLARTLKHVDQKLDLLLAYRRIDQNAALERIYAAAKELLAAPLDEPRRIEVWRLRGELRELRATWRRELEHHLLQIEDPAEEAWIDRMFTSQNSYDEKISGKISGGLVQLMMVEYSLRIDRVLAAASGAWDVSEATLFDELSAIERVGGLLKEKASFISEKQRGSAQPMIEGLGAMVAQYRALPGSRSSRPALTSSATALPPT